MFSFMFGRVRCSGGVLLRSQSRLNVVFFCGVRLLADWPRCECHDDVRLCGSTYWDRIALVRQDLQNQLTECIFKGRRAVELASGYLEDRFKEIQFSAYLTESGTAQFTFSA